MRTKSKFLAILPLAGLLLTACTATPATSGDTPAPDSSETPVVSTPDSETSEPDSSAQPGVLTDDMLEDMGAGFTVKADITTIEGTTASTYATDIRFSSEHFQVTNYASVDYGAETNRDEIVSDTTYSPISAQVSNGMGGVSTVEVVGTSYLDSSNEISGEPLLTYDDEGNALVTYWDALSDNAFDYMFANEFTSESSDGYYDLNMSDPMLTEMDLYDLLAIQVSGLIETPATLESFTLEVSAEGITGFMATLSGGDDLSYDVSGELIAGAPEFDNLPSPVTGTADSDLEAALKKLSEATSFTSETKLSIQGQSVDYLIKKDNKALVITQPGMDFSISSAYVNSVYTQNSQSVDVVESLASMDGGKTWYKDYPAMTGSIDDLLEASNLSALLWSKDTDGSYSFNTDKARIYLEDYDPSSYFGTSLSDYFTSLKLTLGSDGSMTFTGTTEMYKATITTTFSALGTTDASTGLDASTAGVATFQTMRDSGFITGTDEQIESLYSTVAQSCAGSEAVAKHIFDTMPLMVSTYEGPVTLEDSNGNVYECVASFNVGTDPNTGLEIIATFLMENNSNYSLDQTAGAITEEYTDPDTDTTYEISLEFMAYINSYGTYSLGITASAVEKA